VVGGGQAAGDANTALQFLVRAEADLANLNYLTVYASLMNALFYTENYTSPLAIGNDFHPGQSNMMTQDLVDLLTAYVGNANANGTACVQGALDLVLHAQGLMNNPVPNFNTATINLMLDLNHASDVLHGCAVAPNYVWARYWQWGLVQLVKAYVQRGRYAAAVELGCDALDVDAEVCWDRDPLLGEASCRYASGIQFFNQRQVDEALDVYVVARCLMVDLYNAAFPRDAIQTPDECLGVELFVCYQEPV
jgi:hypothetical protein